MSVEEQRTQRRVFVAGHPYIAQEDTKNREDQCRPGRSHTGVGHRARPRSLGAAGCVQQLSISYQTRPIELYGTYFL